MEDSVRSLNITAIFHSCSFGDKLICSVWCSQSQSSYEHKLAGLISSQCHKRFFSNCEDWITDWKTLNYITNTEVFLELIPRANSCISLRMSWVWLSKEKNLPVKNTIINQLFNELVNLSKFEKGSGYTKLGAGNFKRWKTVYCSHICPLPKCFVFCQYQNAVLNTLKPKEEVWK